MKNFLKWIAWTVISIILIIIIAFVLLTFLVKPNDIKPLISQQIFKATGQQVTFKGDIHWKLFPTLSLKLNDAIINNPPNFGTAPLADIKQLAIGIKLLPLLHKEIQTTDLSLNDVTINLINNKAGQTNWEAQQTSPVTTQPSKNETALTKTPQETKTPITLNIPIVAINNMTINWTNQKNSQKATIKNLNVKAENIQQNTAFPVKISFGIESNQPDVHGTIALTSMLTLIPNSTYQLTNLSLLTNLQGKGVPQGKLNTNIKGDAVITPNSLVLNPLNLKTNASNINGQIAIKNFTTFPIQFDLKASPFVMNKLSGSATVKGNITLATLTTSPSINTLNGLVTLDVHNGAYQGINVAYFIDIALALINQQTPPAMTGGNQTTFNDLHTSMVIRNGVANTNDFRVSSPVVNVRGGGTIDFIKQWLNFNLLISSAMSNNVYTQDIPLTISGPLSKPNPSLDKTAILKKVLTQQAKTQIDNAVKNILKSKLFR